MYQTFHFSRRLPRHQFSSLHYVLIGLMLALGPMDRGRAVELADSQSGQLILFPLMFSSGGFDSLLTISNRNPARLAAVRVAMHFVSGESLDFNVYLPGGAQWGGAFTQQQLLTDGSICSIGENESGLASPAALPGDIAWVAIYEMGVAHPIDPLTNLTDLYPPACSNWQEVDFDPPTGELSAELRLINVDEGLSTAVNPTILSEFTEIELHDRPSSKKPDLSSVNPAVARLRVDGRSVTTTWAEPIDAINAVLAVHSLSSDYTIEQPIAAETEVVVAFPTRGFSSPWALDEWEEFAISGRDRAGDERAEPVSKGVRKCTPVRGADGVRPVAAVARRTLGSTGVLDSVAQAATHVDMGVQFCGFHYQAPFVERFDAGRVQLSYLPNGMAPRRSLEGVLVDGMPAIAASLTRVTNGDIAGVRANYLWINDWDRRLRVDYPGKTWIADQSACRAGVGHLGFIASAEGDLSAFYSPDEISVLNRDMAVIARVPATSIQSGRSSGNHTALVFRDGGSVWKMLRLRGGEFEIIDLGYLDQRVVLSANGDYVFYVDDAGTRVRLTVDTGDVSPVGTGVSSTNDGDSILQLAGDSTIVRVHLLTGEREVVFTGPEGLRILDVSDDFSWALLSQSSVSSTGVRDQLLYSYDTIDGVPRLLNGGDTRIPFRDTLSKSLQSVKRLPSVGRAIIRSPHRLDSQENRVNRQGYWEVGREGQTSRIYFAIESDHSLEFPAIDLLHPIGQSEILAEAGDALCRFTDVVHFSPE